jgi:hypothetical protein
MPSAVSAGNCISAFVASVKFTPWVGVILQ